jgi:hypothetical protein
LGAILSGGIHRPATLAILSVDKGRRCDLVHVVDRGGCNPRLVSVPSCERGLKQAGKDVAGRLKRSEPNIQRDERANRSYLAADLVSDHEDLETTVDGAYLQRRAIDWRIIERGAVDDAGEIDLSI